MAGKPLDSQQQQAVGTRRNTVVVAGAGSGKTTVLAQRFVHLVRDEHIPVDRILTLTFTRKAASEMHERIYRLLYEERDNDFVAAQLARFDEAQISTLDSFCGRIVRAAAGRFGVAPDYRTDELELGELARTLSLDFMVRNRRNPVLARLVAANGFDNVQREGLARLATDYLTLVPEQDFAGMRARQLRELTDALERQIAELRSGGERLLAIETEPSKALDERRDAIAALRWDLLSPPAEPDEDYLTALRTRLEALLTFDRRAGKKSDPNLESFRELGMELRRRAELVVSLGETLRLRDELGELFHLVATFRTELADEKRRRGLLSYRDVLTMAIHALAEFQDIRRFFASRFDRVMIDEFQDNNEDQKTLLYLLSLDERAAADRVPDATASMLEAEKLFFVGDEKQSIYRFRGADVRAFKGLADELSAEGSEPVVLRTNYRSAKGLIDFYNLLFENVMQEDDEAARADYEARFEALEAGPAAASQPASVEILYAPREDLREDADAADDTLRPDEAEAYAIAERILAATAGDGRPIADSDGTTRPPGFGDVAVLLRSSGNQILFERVFRALGIPYQTQSVRSLFLEAPAYDAYAWLRLVTVPEDRLAYAAALRSPLTGLSDDGIGVVMTARATGEEAPDAQDLPARPFDLSEEHIGLLSTDDAERLAGAGRIYRRLRELADSAPHTELVSEIWYARGYRYLVLRDPSLHAYAEHYDYLLELARLYERQPLAAFVEALRGQLGQYQRPEDVEVDVHGRHAVQIMTIHKSKGLEFPLVFLANAGNTGRADGMGTSPFYISDEYGLTCNLPTRDWSIANRERSNYFFQVGREEDKARDRAELKRLLYVAATRAQNHLCVSGVFTRQNSRSADHLLNMVLRGIGADPETLAADTTGSQAGSVGAVELAPIPRVARSTLYRRRGKRSITDLAGYLQEVADASVPARAVGRRECSVTDLVDAAGHGGPTGDGAAAAPGAETNEPVSPGAGVGAGVEPPGTPEALFGSVTHAVVDAMVTGTASEASPVGLDALPRDLLLRASEGELAALLPEAVELARRFVESPWGRRLREATGSLRVEAPFVLFHSGRNESAWISGQFDFYLEEEERVVVIDLKTDRQVEPERHALQMYLYRRAAEALSGKPAVSVVHYLRHGKDCRVDTVFSDEEVDELLQLVLRRSSTRQ
jgi:ATP-dependent exoDNAse (exonuclease V) beta subunit